MAALRKAPGVLAVKVDYSSGRATIGMDQDQPATNHDVLAALKSIGYEGEILAGEVESADE